MSDISKKIELQESELLGMDDANAEIVDMDLSAMEAQMSELEEEQRKIKQIQMDVEAQMKVPKASKAFFAPKNNQSIEEKTEADARSIYVGNVDYSVTAEELEKHLIGCGLINRVTIPCDKFSGHPKGFAYVEFSDCEGAQNAMAMNDSILKGRQIKVIGKRTNTPGISTTNRKPRGRGGFGGRGRGGFRGQQTVVVKYIYPGRGRGSRGFKPRGFSAY